MLPAVRTDYGRGESNCPAYDLRIEMTLHNAWREEKGQVNAADNGRLYAAGHLHGSAGAQCSLGPRHYRRLWLLSRRSSTNAFSSEIIAL